MKKTSMIILLFFIYVSFISLGLPDGLLGVGWPLMRIQFNQPLQAAGLVVIIMMPLSTLSSMNAARLKERFGVGIVTFFSALLTAVSLLGIAWSASFQGLLFFSVGLGIGQGGVDTLLNDVVSQHFSSKHMAWLHGFWGIGATLGPALMTSTIMISRGWTLGYSVVGVIQLVIAVGLFLSLPLWKHLQHPHQHHSHVRGTFKPMMLFGMALFFVYVGLEMSIGLWSNSVLSQTRLIPLEISGYFVSLYYFIITLGRFISGFILIKLPTRRLIDLGLGCALIGLIILSFTSHPWLIGLGMALTGLGFAPLYPSMMHDTASRYTPQDVGIAVGYQVGLAYVGGTIISSTMGLVLDSVSLYALYPSMMVGVISMMIIFRQYNVRTQ